MSKKAIKTVSLPLITNIQTVNKTELDRIIKEFKIVYNETSKRMPSLPKDRIKKAKDRVYYEWVKAFRDRKDIDLPSTTAQEAVQKAREAYLSMHSNKNYNRISHGMGNTARFHNQSFNFKHIGDYYFLDLPIRSGRKDNRVLIPIRKSNYTNVCLSKIIEGMKYGASELIRNNDMYWFNLTIKWDVVIGNHGTPIGIDFGLRNIAVACALDNRHPNIKLWNGKESQHKRRIFLSLIKSYQKKGLLSKVKRKKKLYRDYMKTKNHQVSKEIIDFASRFENPYIIIEDLHQFRKQADWTFAELRQFIEYKALHAGMDVIAVNPQFTSQQCNKCGHMDKKSRNGIIFCCTSCGYTLNADVNAAINLSKKTT